MSREYSDRQICRDQVLAVDPFFRMTHVFTDRDVADRVLAVSAFLAAIQEVCTSIVDEGVAARKLAWWRSEADRLRNRKGEHPISTELIRSGAVEGMPPDLIAHLLDAAETRLDPVPPRDRDELALLCQQWGLPRLKLELSVCGVGQVDEDSIRGASARLGLLQLLGNVTRADRDGFWWLPLDLLARHELGRAGLQSPENTEIALKLKSEVLTSGTFENALEIRPETDISIEFQTIRHIFSRDALLIRKVNYMKNSSYFFRWNEISKTGFGDLFACWRAAKQVSPWK